MRRQTEELREPPCHEFEATVAGGLPDFMVISRERVSYLARLARLEMGYADLLNQFHKLEGKLLHQSYDAADRPAVKPQILVQPTEVIISVDELLGGPLAGWVSQIGNSVSSSESLSMDLRWRVLAVAYCELYLKSGLIDFDPTGADSEHGDPLWNQSRALLGQAQGALLDFLKTACEIDSPPAMAEPASKAKGPRVKEEKAKPAIFTNEKPSRKTVCVQRTGEEGGSLKVQVDGVEVGEEASTTKKVLLAACILHLRSGDYDWWETKDLMALALTEDELKDQGKNRAKDLGNWQRALLASSHRLNLEKQQAGRRFRLSAIEFKTSLKEPEIQSQLRRFSEKNPIQRRTRGKHN